MTKKKEQKSQKDTTPEVNEEVLKGSEELEDLKFLVVRSVCIFLKFLSMNH